MGAFVNMSPTGFLISKNGSYNFVKSSPDIYDKIAEKTFDFIGGLNDKK